MTIMQINFEFSNIQPKDSFKYVYFFNLLRASPIGSLKPYLESKHRKNKLQQFSISIFFFSICYSGSLEEESTVATSNHFFLLKKILGCIKDKFFFSLIPLSRRLETTTKYILNKHKTENAMKSNIQSFS